MSEDSRIPVLFEEYHENPAEIFGEIMHTMKSYHPSDDFTIVERAYNLAVKAHEGQFRQSGEPYVIHPLKVAQILTTIEMDRDTIAAAILHDIIEDTPHTREDLEKAFSPEIAALVEGVTKLAKVNYDDIDREPWQREADLQADNYRKMFLAMSNDIRVILIKLADRLHNLRTMKHMPAAHKKKKADETLDIYAPLANRLGIAKLRYEMEDLAFRYQNPEAYEDLKNRVQRKLDERQSYINGLVDSISVALKEGGIDANVSGRPKHFFSIYRKMMQKDKTLDQIYDLFAVRILVDTVEECWSVLGYVNAMYSPIPMRFKDYINRPKSNMYRSLHNTLIGPGGNPFEVQIRTNEMHKTSEHGIAAHWRYKNKVKGQEIDSEKKLDWLHQILNWQRDLSDSSEYLSELKQDLDLYKDRIFCFTPKGRSIELVRGSTPIDFAYAVHSDVGNMMVGAMVNEKIAPLNTVLQLSDRVEILTSPTSKGPSRDWLKICQTGQARTKINSWFKKQNREENILNGLNLLENGAKRKGFALKDLSTQSGLSAVLSRFHFNDWDALCAAVGHGSLSEIQVLNRLILEYEREKGTSAEDEEKIMQQINESQNTGKPKRDDKLSLPLKGDRSMAVHLALCCNPMPGDGIVGFITRGRGISIHRDNCANVNPDKMNETNRQRITNVEWSSEEDGRIVRVFPAALDILAENKTGVVADISKLMVDERINMDSINTFKRKTDILVRITFAVNGKAQLDRIITKVEQLRGIHEVKRTIN